MAQNSVINRNEDLTNQITAKIFFYCILVCILAIGLGYTSLSTTNIWVMYRDFGISAVLLFIPYFVYFILKKTGPWFKYLIVFTFVVVQINLYLDFELYNYVFILWLLPILLANLYFDQRLSIVVSIITMLSINIIDIIHGASIFTPITTGRDGHNTIIANVDIIADCIWLDITIGILLATSIALAGRSKRLLSDLVSTEEKTIILEKLARLMKEANQISTVLVESAKKLSDISVESKKTNEMSAEYSKTTATTTRTTLELIRNSNPLFVNLADRVQEIAQYILELNNIASKLNEVTTEGSLAITQATEEMEAISKASQQSKNAMTKLSVMSKKIEQIVRTISIIARQTNLLALNASIEASRAGEQGHGFQVVASSIRDLATQAAQATESIRDLVAGVQKEVAVAVESIENEANLTQAGLLIIHRAGQAFEAINTTEDILSNRANQISAATQEIAANSNQVISAADEIEKNAQIGMSNAENIAAAADQQLSSTRELLTQSERVYVIAEKLNRLGRKTG
jgi:methyl-accepting chemotaxis protein